jgi:RHS repeat-associated protein
MDTSVFSGAGSDFSRLVSEISYTPAGAPQREKYGNGLIHSMSYNERLQLAEMSLGRPDNLESVFRIGYIYGTAHSVNVQDPEITLAQNNGNVARIKYFISGALQYSQTFQYDPVDRLSYAVEHNNGTYNDGARAWYQTFDYDLHGNRGINPANTSDNASAAGSALRLADFSRANNRITRAGYVYDAAGNLIAEPGKTFTYSAENKIVTATVAGGATSQYVYDGNERRVKKVVGGVATRFEYGAGGELVAERNDSNGVVIRDYFYKGEELLATATARTNGEYEYEYATADHLGSPRAWTDDSGNLVAGGRHDYMPFGEELFVGYGVRTTNQGYAASGQADGQRKQFGAREHDSETGLEYSDYRYYSPTQGRFTSADPLNASSTLIVPQGWNLYSYTINNPLKYTDPTGLDWWYKTGDGVKSPQWFDSDPGSEYARWTDIQGYVYQSEISGLWWALNPRKNEAQSFKTAEEAMAANQSQISLNMTQSEIEFNAGLTEALSPVPFLVNWVNSEAGMDVNSRDYSEGATIGSLAGITSMVSGLEETFNQAVYKSLMKSSEKIGKYTIDGTKGIVGDTFARNIFYIGAEKKDRSLSGLIDVIGQMESEAKAAGAKRLSIVGHAITNTNFANPATMQKLAARFGYTYKQVNDSTMVLVKTLGQ